MMPMIGDVAHVCPKPAVIGNDQFVGERIPLGISAMSIPDAAQEREKREYV